jgi:predicted dehydrogenase
VTGEHTDAEEPVTIAIIGCGAVTELRHLPALARRHDCRVAALVDSNKARAEQLAARFRVPHILQDYRSALELKLDAAIIALPNHLHASVSIPMLAAGVHLLVEKPLALSVAESTEMIRAAESGGAVLAVGLSRRFSHAGRFTKWVLEKGLLGRITGFDVREGSMFNWPLASDFFFRKEAAGGGVLIDTGAHTLDQLLWWFGDVKSLDYSDDSAGGVEADCELHLTFESGVTGVIEISRIRRLRNTAIIRGEQAQLEVGLHRNTLTWRYEHCPMHITGQGAPHVPGATADQDHVDLVAAEHADWLEAIRTGRAPSIPAPEGRRSVALIEACYQRRRPLRLPWEMLPGERLSASTR